ncbi:hypothetical protein D3C73_1098670 [compost metagenome]
MNLIKYQIFSKVVELGSLTKTNSNSQLTLPSALSLFVVRFSALSVTASFHTKTDCSGHPFKSFAGSL